MTASTADLTALAAEIGALGEKIKSLKAATPVDTEAVTAAVASLLATKKRYAENNNGVGVDGKPWQKSGDKQMESGPAKQVRACVWSSRVQCLSYATYYVAAVQQVTVVGLVVVATLTMSVHSR